MDHPNSVGSTVVEADNVGQGGGSLREATKEGYHAQHGESP